MIGKVKGKSEIVAIPNKYKNTLDDRINNSDINSLDQPNFPDLLGLIDKRLPNMPRSRNGLSTLLKKESLDEDIEIPDSQVHQYYDIASLDPKSWRVQYGKSQRGRENGKSNRSRENKKGQRGEGDY